MVFLFYFFFKYYHYRQEASLSDLLLRSVSLICVYIVSLYSTHLVDIIVLKCKSDVKYCSVITIDFV